ncbi:MAG: nitrite/sulfite reductase [Chloroflexi bacterium]|nr:nitrite/sulfite reductase [Chloroflexota bacterium]
MVEHREGWSMSTDQLNVGGETTARDTAQGILSASAAEIDTFETEVTRFRQGEWDANAFVRFRTLQGIYGQRQPEAQMVRVKAPLGVLTAEQLEILGRIAQCYTLGQRGHVTTRQDIQFHFVKLEDTPAVMRLLGAAGLTTREACGNAVRNVTGSPFAGVCPREPFDVTPYAAAYARYFLRHPLTQHLPRKFKSSFSCCDEDDTISDIQDLGFIPRLRHEEGREQRGFLVKVGGGTSIFPRTGFVLTEFVPVEGYLRLAEAVLRVFDRSDELRQNRMKARLKFHVQRVGIEAFRTEVEAELRQPWACSAINPASLLHYVNDEAPLAFSSSPSRADSGESAFCRWRDTNTMGQHQPGFRIVTIRLPLGTIEAEQFSRLAQLARVYGSGRVYTTVQQNLILRWVREDRLEDLYRGLRELALADEANTITDVTSCPGTDSCKSALTATMGLGRALSAALRVLEHTDPLVETIHIKVDGCPNGCGHHHLGTIGLHGAAMKGSGRQVPAYELFLGGSYTGNCATGGTGYTRFGQRVKVRLPAKRVPEAILRIVRFYQAERRDGEIFNAFVDRAGLDPFAALLADLQDIPPLGPATLDLYQDWEREALYRVERGEGECAV